MTEVTCSFCGHSFDPQTAQACSDCPFKPGCHLVRCPACGFEAVDPQQSWLARWFLKFWDSRRQVHHISRSSGNDAV